MDDDFITTRQMLREAIALDDAARTDFEQFESERRVREQTELRQHLIRKTHMPQPTQQQQHDLDPITQARWDAWLDRRVSDMLSKFAGAMGDEVGRTAAKLQAEISQLREEVELLRSIAAGKTVDMKRDRDVA